jgi:hypothetical protein
MKMKRMKTGGRSKGTPNASNANIRQMMRDYVVSEFEFIQMHLHELTIPERAMLLKSLVRYGVAPLAPENDSGEDISPIIIQVHPDL